MTMTAMKGILGGCVEGPDDDTPRHVLADWLDDQGDADRAEFVRGQLAAARMDEDDPARQALDARLKTLQARHSRAWVASLRRQVSRFRFQRGLLHVGLL